MCVSVCIYEFKPNQIEKNPFLLRHSKFRRLWLRVFSTFFLIMQCCYSHFKILIIIDLILTTLVKTSLATFLADRWLQFSKTTDRINFLTSLLAICLTRSASISPTMLSLSSALLFPLLLRSRPIRNPVWHFSFNIIFLFAVSLAYTEAQEMCLSRLESNRNTQRAIREHPEGIQKAIRE